MYEALLRRARDLKRRSRTLRDQGDYPGAEDLLTQAITLLGEAVISAQQKLPTSMPAPPDVRELATELADCWGSLGGVRRRHADALRRNDQPDQADRIYRAALEAYDKGMALEQDDLFRIADSYNLVQSAVVPVLTSPELLGNHQFQLKLREIALSIDRQIATARPEDPWAYSDLGLVQLLSGEEATANRMWDKMDALKPQRKVYTSGLPVLEALSSTLSDHQALRRAAERFRARVASSAVPASS